jgi:aminoglycoside phosphotransferase (APT) family kinase protein
MRIPLPPQVALPGPTEVFLHGDFNTYNVCLRRCGEPIVILDWCMAPFFGERATYGTRYLDLAWFVACMFYLPVHRYPICEPPAPRAQRFLRSYYRAAGCDYNQGELRRYMKNFMGIQWAVLKSAPWRQRVTLTPRWARLSAFMESISL